MCNRFWKVDLRIEAYDYIRKNPYERIQNEMTVQLQKLAKELGITPNSRARIEMNRAKNHEDTSRDPFLKVVNSNGWLY